MARASTIDRLPGEIREAVSNLRRNGRTIDEILEHLRQLGADVSRASLGRHVKSLEKVAELSNRALQIAEGLGSRFGDQQESTLARGNIQMLHTIVMNLIAPEGEAKLDAKDAMFMATAVEKLLKASKTDADRELKIREEERKEATRKAAAVVESVAKNRGLSADTVQEIKAQILGIRS